MKKGNLAVFGSWKALSYYCGNVIDTCMFLLLRQKFFIEDSNSKGRESNLRSVNYEYVCLHLIQCILIIFFPF